MNMPGKPLWMTASLVAHHLPHLRGPEAVVLGATTVAAAAAGAVHHRHVSEPAAPRPPAPRHGLRRRIAAGAIGGGDRFVAHRTSPGDAIGQKLAAETSFCPQATAAVL